MTFLTYFLCIIFIVLVYILSNKKTIGLNTYVLNSYSKNKINFLKKMFGKNLFDFHIKFTQVIGNLILWIVLCFITITFYQIKSNIHNQKLFINNEQVVSFNSIKKDSEIGYFTVGSNIFGYDLKNFFDNDIISSKELLSKNEKIKNKEGIEEEKEIFYFGDNDVKIKTFEDLGKYNLQNANLEFDLNKISELFINGSLKLYYLKLEEFKEIDGKSIKIQSLKQMTEFVLGEDILKVAFDIHEINHGFDWSSVLSTIYYVLFFVFLILIMKNMSGITKLKNSDILTNEDLGELPEIGGNDGLKKTIEEIVKLNKVGNKIDSIKGILLYGPPGTGKTLFGKHIAKKLNLPFKYISSGQFANKYYGGTKDMIKSLFKDVRESMKKNKTKNLILFLDELDSIGIKREYGRFHQDGLNQMLTEIDGFSSDDGIIIIGATNLLEQLDDALLSRFNLKVYVGLPNKDEREEIFKNQLKFIYENTTNNGSVVIKN